MRDLVLVSRDRTRLLPPNSPEKGWQISRADAKKLGLLESEEKPTQQRRTQATQTPTEPRKPQKRRTARKSE